MSELNRIQTFIKVVEAGSFSAAARHTLSVSAVARQVKSLENELGVRLLNRSTRSLSLTEPGEVFYRRVRAIANDLSQAISEAKSFQADVKGTLRVSLRVAAGTTVVIPALPTFLDRHPELSVEVILTDERLDLISNNIDVAVWMGDLADSELIARLLNSSKRVVCGSPSYLERHGIPSTPEELANHNVLLYTEHSYATRWSFTKEDQRQDIEVQGNVRSDNTMVLLFAAMAGTGLIIVNQWMVQPLIAQGRLVPVLSDYLVNQGAGEPNHYAVYASSRGMSRKVRAFVDFLMQLSDDGAVQADAQGKDRAWTS
jgi:DNA-binding transcriptional LysR family regulator